MMQSGAVLINQLRQNPIQVARSLLALSTLITIAATSDKSLFRLVLGAEDVIHCDGVARVGAYCISPSTHIATAMGVVICLWVISGILPRWSALPHAWFAFSLDVAISIPEGGDQVNHNLTFLIVVICILDGRGNGWSLNPGAISMWNEKASLYKWAVSFSLVAIQVQISIIYLHAALGKVAVREWQEGSAFYYIINGQFGLPRIFDSIGAVFSAPVLTVGVSWGVIALELILGIAVLLPNRIRISIITLGVLFHIGIIVAMGLWSFGLAMFACLVILTIKLDNNGYHSILPIIKRGHSPHASNGKQPSAYRNNARMSPELQNE